MAHCAKQRGSLPDVWRKQAAVGLQGPGGTLNQAQSAEEMLKASVSNEGQMNVLLCLVGM